MLRPFTTWRFLLPATALVVLFALGMPRLLTFDLVRAPCSTGPYDALVWRTPISFEYDVRGRTYRVEEVVFDGSANAWPVNSIDENSDPHVPIYVNRVFPSWWRWERPISWHAQLLPALRGLVFLLALLCVRRLFTGVAGARHAK